ncbi:MAG: outer membrane beta-barrel protein [Deltaproteobacteria bacterium]|nr:outer membrane beta-barrel protein [Deltaproteobacteria bacterium]
MIRFAVVLVAVLAVPAFAQSGGGVAAQTGGVSLSEDGRSRLHLGLDAGVGFDTNPYTTPLASGQFAGDVTARVRPYLEVNAPGSLLTFTSKGQLDYGFLPGVIDEETQNFLLYQSAISADLEVNRGGMFTFAMGDTVSWNNDPGVAVIGSQLNRVNNQLRAGVGWTPGGGALQMRLGYTFGFLKYIDFENNGGIIGQGELDTMSHGLQLRADYRFLPKTGVFATLGAGFQNYPFTDTQGFAVPVGVSVGLQGNVLPKVAGLVSLGYSNPLTFDTSGALTTGAVFGLVGQIEAQWAATPMTAISGGFQRKFDPIALYGYVAASRFYGALSQTLLGRFAFSANAGYSVLEFGAEQSSQELTDAAVGRLDGHLDAGLRASYFFFDWFSVGISNVTDWRLTNANDVSSVAEGGDPLNLGYVRNETLLLASVRY